jgi:hypothetical protein
MYKAIVNTLEESQLKRNIETSPKPLQLGKITITSDLVIFIITACIIFTQTLLLCMYLRSVLYDQSNKLR